MSARQALEPVAGRVKLLPSLLAANFAELGAKGREALDAGASGLHADVMDGRFVPPITFGADVVRDVIAATGAPTDAHLMIVEPERQIEAFAKAGVRGLTVHQEACPHLHRVLSAIHEVGLEAGVALNPATPVESLRNVAPHLDRILVMTVNPGWGGQSFIEGSLARISQAANLLRSGGREGAEVQVDGGVGPDNAGEIVRAGATELVAGSAIFKGDVAANITAFREAVQKALAV
jgi:ribulose-phosphate 3-epimerase